MARQTEWDMKITDPMNRVWKHPRGYLEGCVITKHGIVSVYCQSGPDEVHHTALNFVHNGRLYSRGIDKSFTQRGLVTIANRFAHEVVDARGNHDQTEEER
jgi:hypothetical protein